MKWLEVARADIGLRELPGAPTAPKISGWLRTLGAWWTDDATPWCGTACAAWMRAAGLPIPDAWFRAKAWATWGQPLRYPAQGCIVVFERTGGGHVGLVTGEERSGRLLVLGGNQGDAVSIASFGRDRVLAYRWPPGEPLPEQTQLAQGSAPASVSEA